MSATGWEDDEEVVDVSGAIDVIEDIDDKKLDSNEWTFLGGPRTIGRRGGGGGGDVADGGG